MITQLKFVLTALLLCVGVSLGTAADAANKTAKKSKKNNQADGEWTVLFDGHSTDKLRGYKMDSFPSDKWVIDGDALRAVPGKSTDLVTKNKFKNFELELEWKVSKGGNGGVMYRVSEDFDEPWHSGPEMQIVDDLNHSDGKNPKTSAGSLYDLIAPNDKKKLNPAGEWNKARVVFKKKHVEHWLNGEKILEYDWNSPQLKGLISQSKFKDKPRFMQEKKGHIDFQHHGQELWLRNIRIRKV